MDIFDRGKGAESYFERFQRQQEEEKEKHARNKLVKDVQTYRLDRLTMMTDLKKKREELNEIVYHGVSNAETERVARLACCILAADLCVEEAALMDKTGEMTELLKSPDVIDDIDEGQV